MLFSQGFPAEHGIPARVVLYRTATFVGYDASGKRVGDHEVEVDANSAVTSPLTGSPLRSACSGS